MMHMRMAISTLGKEHAPDSVAPHGCDTWELLRTIQSLPLLQLINVLPF